MIEAVIKCFERSTVERMEENSNDVYPAVYLYDNVNKYTKIRSWRNEEQKVDLQKKRNCKRMAVLQSYRLGKGKGKKKKKRYYNTGYSYLVTDPSTNDGEQGSTLLSGRNMLLSLL